MSRDNQQFPTNIMAIRQARTYEEQAAITMLPLDMDFAQSRIGHFSVWTSSALNIVSKPYTIIRQVGREQAGGPEGLRIALWDR
jgi:hypothetical protein